MRKTQFLSSVKVTVPVMMGYLPLGAAFGLLLASAEYGPAWALLMSVVIYAGSGQILGVSLLAAGSSLPQVALLTFVLNLRHVVYGLSMLERFRAIKGLKKLYLIFSLTDETYALLASAQVPDTCEEQRFYLTVALLNQCYWIIGSLIGNFLGSAVGSIPAGVDFAMTALFVVIAIGQWQGTRDHAPAIIGLAAAFIGRLLFGAGNEMLLAALVIILVCLSLYKPRTQTQGIDASKEVGK